MAQRTPPVERFWPKVEKTADCWLWTGYVDRGGYGKFNRGDNQMVQSHRFSYEQTVGPVPDGLELDHLCRVKHCVNPAHLEPVTHDENMRRRAEAQTHCKWGHEFTTENTRISRRGFRICRACDVVRQMASRARRRNS